MDNEKTYWTICEECHGHGKKAQRIRKKVKLKFQAANKVFFEKNQQGVQPKPPVAPLVNCVACKGSGLKPSNNYPEPNDAYPHVAIIGGGIGGMALAVACLHRGIPFTLFERDISFENRSQGYGLTLQQASNAMQALGILFLEEAVISTRHLLYQTDGKVIGEWGMRKWQKTTAKKPKRTNMHIARQALRLALLKQIGGPSAPQLQWGFQLVGITETKDKGVKLNFQKAGETKMAYADIVVGADGIRSTVRNFIINPTEFPLLYLGCIVILGICPLALLKDTKSPLLDSATVFQTVNGNERIYVMPFSHDTIMWQLSVPMLENEAKELSKQGPATLKAKAIEIVNWHNPLPQIILATSTINISGYPVYDRALLKPNLLQNSKQITLIGDAAHPMSPFKGQGANQAILDALCLARNITKGCNPKSAWRTTGIRKNVLTAFEKEMTTRSSSKVIGSAEAAHFLHTHHVLHQSDQPRGSVYRQINKPME